MIHNTFIKFWQLSQDITVFVFLLQSIFHNI